MLPANQINFRVAFKNTVFFSLCQKAIGTRSNYWTGLVCTEPFMHMRVLTGPAATCRKKRRESAFNSLPESILVLNQSRGKTLFPKTA